MRVLADADLRWVSGGHVDSNGPAGTEDDGCGYSTLEEKEAAEAAEADRVAAEDAMYNAYHELMDALEYGIGDADSALRHYNDAVYGLSDAYGAHAAQIASEIAYLGSSSGDYGGGGYQTIAGYTPNENQNRMASVLHEYKTKSDVLAEHAVRGGLEQFTGGDLGLTPIEREVALATMFQPAHITRGTVDGVTVGYVNDGKTVLFDYSGNGVFDGAAQLDGAGTVYTLEANGWRPNDFATTGVSLRGSQNP